MLIGVVGDYKPGNETHTTLDASLAQAGAECEWVATDRWPNCSSTARVAAG